MQFLFFIGQSSRLYFISFLSYRHLFMTDINKSQVSKRIRVSSEVFDRISLLANNNSISVTQVVEKALDDYENNLQFPYSKKNYFLTQNIEMLNKNLMMCQNIVEVLKIKKPNHLIYISSDAVYSDSKKKINEKSETSPSSLHGFMHLIRENMLNEIDCLKSFVRPTLVFGSDDPHNGYGPNKLIRCAQNDEQIVLFGKGEERRDHIHVDNVYFLNKPSYHKLEV